MKKYFKSFVILIAMLSLSLVLGSCEDLDGVTGDISFGGHTHEFGEWETTRNATCNATGERTRYCGCGDKQTEEIPLAEHRFVDGTCIVCEKPEMPDSTDHVKDPNPDDPKPDDPKPDDPNPDDPNPDDPNPDDPNPDDPKPDDPIENNCTHPTESVVIINGTAPTCAVEGTSYGAKCNACGDMIVAQKPIPSLEHEFYGFTCTICGYNSSDIIKEQDQSYRNEIYTEIEDIYGAEFVEALKELASLYSSDVIAWIASLYSTDIGGFYYSESARDNVEFLPDIESTSVALNALASSGAFDSSKDIINILPAEMKAKMIYFVKSLQSKDDGFFYHPQWGTNVTIARRARDLSWAESLLQALGARPTYDTPTGMYGDGILADGTTVATSVTMPLNSSAVVAASKVISTSSSLPAHISSPEAFRAYLASLDIANNPYRVSAELSSQVSIIKHADSVTDWRPVAILIDWLNSYQMAHNGLWGVDEVSISDKINALSKIVQIYTTFKYELPYSTLAFNSTISYISSDSEPRTIMDIYNPILTISYIVTNQKNYSDNLESLESFKNNIYEKSAIIIDSAATKLKIFSKNSGSFSYFKDSTSNTVQGSPSSVKDVREGDIINTNVAFSIYRNLMNIFGIGKLTLFGEYERIFAIDTFNGIYGIKPHIHSYSEWKTASAPTCIADGKWTRSCSCGYTDSIDIPALGHVFIDNVCRICSYEIPNFDDQEYQWTTTDIRIQLYENDNNGELSSGLKKYYAGQNTASFDSIDELVNKRNVAASAYTKTNPIYSYETAYGWGASVQDIQNLAYSGSASAPDIFVNFAYDMTACALRGCFANLYSNTDLAPGSTYGNGGNYFSFTKYGYVGSSENYFDSNAGNGYFFDYMQSLTFANESGVHDKMYLVASNYTLDAVRAMQVIPVNIEMLESITVEASTGDRDNDGDFDVEDFYDLVWDYEWTYDKLAILSEAVYMDTNKAVAGADIKDTLGFCISRSAGLSAGGILYSSSVKFIDKVEKDGKITYKYPNANEVLSDFAATLADLFVLGDGICAISYSDVSNAGFNVRSDIEAIQKRFYANKILFGGVIMIGNLEHADYQNMSEIGKKGFGFVPVPLYEQTGALDTNGKPIQSAYDFQRYNTLIHNLARVVAISTSTTEFEQCSAYLDYVSANSAEIVDTYCADNLNAESGSAANSNKMMFNFIKNHAITAFDKTYEDIIVAVLSATSSNPAIRWHGIFASNGYVVTNIDRHYQELLTAKQALLKNTLDQWATLK